VASQEKDTGEGGKRKNGRYIHLRFNRTGEKGKGTKKKKKRRHSSLHCCVGENKRKKKRGEGRGK